MVEHNLAKVGVASSSLVSRSSIKCVVGFFLIICGNSSVDRAQPCQGWGREFESRFPLQTKLNYTHWRDSRVVMHRPAKPRTPVRFRLPPPQVKWCSHFGTQCRDGGTGRRKGLKIPRAFTPVPVRFRLAAPFSLLHKLYLITFIILHIFYVPLTFLFHLLYF